MKIAIFTDNFIPGVGGTEKAVFGLATSLSKQHEVAVCCPEYQYKNEDEFPFKVIRANSMSLTNTEMYAFPELSSSFKKELKKFTPDVIHCHTVFSMANYAIKYGKKHNIPVLFTVHTKFKTSFSHAIKSKAIVKLLLKNIAKKLNKSDKVYTVSNDMAAELNSYGYKGDVQVVRNGAMFEKVQNLITLKESSRKFLNISQDEIVFLFVGRIVRIKNLEFIVNALKLVEQKMPDFKMIFVGDGVDLKYMKQYVTDIGLANKVIFTGQVTNKTTISALYSSADLFVFPSIFDNDPLTVVEAAVHKVPSLTLENTGSSERINNGISGFTCENDVNKFADKILSIVSDKEKLKAVGENAEKMIPKSWDQTASEYVEIYKNAIMEKNALKAENKDKKKQKSAKKKKSLENA